jgi:hypothetical protein
MSQQLISPKVYSSTHRFFRIYDSIRKWIAKEIIDFDPFDDEIIVAQELLEQFQQTQISLPS